MAISIRAVGSWAAATATTQTVTLPTHSTGDMLIVRVVAKGPATLTNNLVICDTTGWNPVGNMVFGGSTASSNGGGSVWARAFYKVATSAAETNPVLTFQNPSGTNVAMLPSAAVAISYQKGASEEWVTPVGNGAAVAAATAISASIGSVSSVSGDMIDAFVGTNDNTTLTVPTFTQSGMTFNTVTEAPGTALSSATSNDISADGSYRLATAGTSSGNIVITGTNSVADEGVGYATRLRVQAVVALTPDPGVITLSAPNVSVAMGDLTLTPDPGVFTLSAPTPTVEAVIPATTLTPDPAVITLTMESAGGGGSTVATDTFTGSSGTPLTSHTPDTGAGWQRLIGQPVSGEPNLIGGVRLGYASGDGDLFDFVNVYVINDEVTDGYAQANLRAQVRDIAASAVAIRVNASGYGYIAVESGDVYRLSGQVWTLVGNIGGSGYWFRFQATGTSPTYLKVERRTDSSFTGTWTYETSDNTSAHQTGPFKSGILGWADADYQQFGSDIDDFLLYDAGGGGGTGPITLSHVLTLTPDPAVITLAAPSVGIIVDQTLTPDPAVITLQATQPAITAVLTVAPDPGVFVITATDPTVSMGALTLTPDAAVIVLAAATPTVAMGAITMAPDPAVITLQATQPTLALAYSLAPDPAAFTLVASGVTIGVESGATNLAPDPAVITLAAADVSVALGALTLTPGSAVIQITAPQPTVAMGPLTLTPDPASFALAAASVAIAHALTITPEPAALVLQAAQVGVAHALALTPDPGVLSLLAPVPQIIVEGAPVDLTVGPVAFSLVAPSVTVTVVAPATRQEGKARRRRQDEAAEYTLDDDDVEVIALILLTWA